MNGCQESKTLNDCRSSGVIITIPDLCRDFDRILFVAPCIFSPIRQWSSRTDIAASLAKRFIQLDKTAIFIAALRQVSIPPNRENAGHRETRGRWMSRPRSELRKDALFPRGRPPFAPGVIVFRGLSGIQSGRPTHRQKTSAPLITDLRLKKLNDIATSIFFPAPLKQDAHHTSKKVSRNARPEVMIVTVLGASVYSSLRSSCGLCYLGVRLRLLSRNLLVEVEVGCCRRGDHSRTTTESEVLECPLNKHQHPALKLDDVHQVNERPNEPRRQPGELESKCIRNRSGASNHGKVSLVIRVCGQHAAAAEIKKKEPSERG